MAKNYLVVNEDTGHIVSVSEADAWNEGYRRVEPSEMLLYGIRKDIASIKTVTGLIGLFIVLGIIASILGVRAF
jgi:hypothetical protein